MLKIFTLFLSVFLYLLPLHALKVYENGAYSKICHLAATNDDVFANFKRDPSFQNVHNVSYEMGLEYLKFIQNEYPELIPYFDRFKQNDDLGNPIKYFYNGYGELSPTTLQYIKFLGDLRSKFGDLSKLNIVEIGGGCGGLCKVISTFGFASYTIIDIPESISLAKKCLSKQNVNNVTYINSSKLKNLKKYDLVISNFSFSESDIKEQSRLFNSLFKATQNGYLVMNFISIPNMKFLSLEAIIRALYKYKKYGKVEKERPSTHPNNMIVSWKKENKNSKKYIFPLYNPATNGNAVTYSFSGGRFGDNLIAYLHAKWIAYKYNLPFLYKPFEHSNLLKLDERNQPLSSFSFANDDYYYLNHQQMSTLQPCSKLITVLYAPDTMQEIKTSPVFNLEGLPFVKVDWDDPTFHAEVVKCLTPKKPVKTLKLPKDKITVGVHIRRGGGVDNPVFLTIWPLKFPPDSFFINEIKRIAKIFKNQKLYVYLMTDDRNPKDILKKYKKEINNPNIQFDCRKDNNGPHSNLLEDFYLIPKFDCFVISQSNFSLVASKIKKHSLLISPMNFEMVNGQPVINEVEIVFKPKSTK